MNTYHNDCRFGSLYTKIRLYEKIKAMRTK